MPSADIKRTAPLIGGKWVSETSLGKAQHLNPANNQPQAEFAVGGAKEIDAAAEAALKGHEAWIAVPPDRRRDILTKWADLVRDHAPEFVRLAALESGLPTMLGGGGELAQRWFRYYASLADKIVGEVVEPTGAAGMNYTLHEPYGVVGLIIPWNSPMVASSMKVTPALAAGNAVILKPPTLTPFVALRLAELALEAGLPEGTFNVVPGDAEAGNALVANPHVGKISFTGGGPVAKIVMHNCADHLKPLALELGGKSANLIFEDADLDASAQMAGIQGCAVLSGQGCVLPTRAYVHESVYDAFVERVKAVVESFAVGDPLDAKTFVGPVISQASAKRILGVIETAKAQNMGRVVTGGVKLGGALEAGNFVAPTVFADVPHESSLSREEIFGPVLAVSRFTDEADAVRKANDSIYGLGAYVHTQNLTRAHRLARQLKSGAISINSGVPMAPNTPFGGYKQSGFGREGGKVGLEEFLQMKNVYIPF
ncbi:MAG: aldehyde dehydrogenase [Caulobacteraceae bacterium]|nr:aldehyde dehydrogenase [Caulobacteraceae bacterium]